MITRLKIQAAIIALLTICCLPAPFIKMKISPQGKHDCGFDVPDVYILGMGIIGKDTSFWGIAFAVVFQLIIIVITIVLVLFFYQGLNRDKIRQRNIIINIFFLCLFPFWMNSYVEGVVGNSDCATVGLVITKQIGYYLYYAIFILTSTLLLQVIALKSVSKKQAYASTSKK